MKREKRDAHNGWETKRRMAWTGGAILVALILGLGLSLLVGERAPSFVVDGGTGCAGWLTSAEILFAVAVTRTETGRDHY
jgi:hypothetical protein